jgi:hypothetical protein
MMPVRPFTRLTAAGLVALALVAAGCGGDGGGSSDEDKITEVLEAVAEDPSSICEHFTDETLSTLGGADGCRQAGESSDSEGGAVEIDDIAVDGDTATARVTQQEGDSTISLVRVGDQWRIDSSS